MGHSSFSDFADSIIELVVESDSFRESVTEVIKNDIGHAVNEEMDNQNIELQIGRAVEEHLGEIGEHVETLQQTVQQMEVTITLLNKGIAKLMEENENLKARIQYNENSYHCLSKLIQNTRETLRKIPIIKRWFTL